MTVEIPVKCKTCHGEGKYYYMVTADDVDLEYCEDCEGKGEIEIQTWASNESDN